MKNEQKLIEVIYFQRNLDIRNWKYPLAFLIQLTSLISRSRREYLRPCPNDLAPIPSHVGIVLNGDFYDATGKGVRKMSKEEALFRHKYCTIYGDTGGLFGVHSEHVTKLQYYLDNRIGEGYSWTKAAMSYFDNHFLRFIKLKGKKTFCSAFVAEALAELDIHILNEGSTPEEQEPCDVMFCRRRQQLNGQRYTLFPNFYKLDKDGNAEEAL